VSFGFREERKNRGRIHWGTVSGHEEQAGGVEHGALGVDLFAEVLGLDVGVSTTIAANLARDKLAIKGMNEGHIIGGESPETAEPVLFLVGFGAALLATEEGGGRSGGAPEDAGGIGAGDHRGKLAVIGGRADILSFVHREEGGGRGADGVGDGTPTEEMDAGPVKPNGKASLGVPATASEGVAIQTALKAKHGIEGLRIVGGGNGDNLDILPGKEA
jgi:hypothetical protein